MAPDQVGKSGLCRSPSPSHNVDPALDGQAGQRAHGGAAGGER